MHQNLNVRLKLSADDQLIEVFVVNNDLNFATFAMLDAGALVQHNEFSTGRHCHGSCLRNDSY